MCDGLRAPVPTKHVDVVQPINLNSNLPKTAPESKELLTTADLPSDTPNFSQFTYTPSIHHQTQVDDDEKSQNSPAEEDKQEDASHSSADENSR